MKSSDERGGVGGESPSSETSDGVLSRRELLQGAGAAALTLGVSACSSDDDAPGDKGGDDGGDAGPLGPSNLFQHGVASGDPLPNAVILWTRVSPADGTDSVEVHWEMAADPEFESIVAEGDFTTDADRDFTVKVDATGLEAGRTYYYRFSALGRTSVIGRTRTAPSGPVSGLRFAVVSCANYAQGYFHVYARIAERADLDAVIHLGDYIYEYGSGQYGATRDQEPAHEIVSLSDYRTRHSAYKRDPDLHEAHRQHPFICIWDDHEIANNAWRDGAQNHQEPDEGTYADRKAAALKAYMEWMPIREQGSTRIYRKLSYGDLVDLLLLDTRHWGRIPEDLGVVGPPPPPDPERTLLGDEQAAWLEQELESSTAHWKLVGQQVMLANLIIGLAEDGVTPALLGNLDQWQGYPESRARFVSFLEESGVENVVVLTGDIHASFANEIVTNPNDAAEYDPETGSGSLAVEFVTPAITSEDLGRGYLRVLGQEYSEEAITNLVESVRPFNPHIRYVDITRKGYVVLDVNAERVQGAWFYVADVESTSGSAETFATARSVASGSARLIEDAEPASPPSEVPDLAP